MVKKIKIGDRIYNVLEDPNLSHQEGLTGQIRYQESTIRVFPLLEPQELAHVLLHEAVHGMLRFMGEDEKNNDEDSVNRLANGLLMLVRDNSALFRTWMDEV